MKKAIIMGNGPSLGTVDFGLLKDSKISTYATNRIAGICRQKEWYPDYYSVFFASPHQGSILKLPNGQFKNYSEGNSKEALGSQKDISFVCKNKNTKCYVHEWYRHFLKESPNVNFVNPTLWDRFKEFPMGIMDKYSAPNNFLWWIATTSLFQLCVYHEIDTIGIIGVDGYNTSIENNHYKGYVGADPGNMESSNKKIIRQHDVISEYLKRKKIKTYNLSDQSIIKNYPSIKITEFYNL